MIDGNKIHRNKYSSIAILFDGYRGIVEYVDITNNEIYENKEHGIVIWFVTDGTLSNVDIAEDKITENGANSLNIHVAAGGVLESFVIKKNKMTKNIGNGVITNGDFTIIKNSEITWNGEYGVYLKPGSEKQS